MQAGAPTGLREVARSRGSLGRKGDICGREGRGAAAGLCRGGGTRNGWRCKEWGGEECLKEVAGVGCCLRESGDLSFKGGGGRGRKYGTRSSGLHS